MEFEDQSMYDESMSLSGSGENKEGEEVRGGKSRRRSKHVIVEKLTEEQLR
jgi:hypothetical protein